MATISPTTERLLLETHEAITTLNNSIKTYKTCVSVAPALVSQSQSFEDPNKLLDKLNDIKSNWDQSKSKLNIPGLEKRCEIVEVALNYSQEKLKKILRKSPAQTSFTSAQSTTKLQSMLGEIAQRASQGPIAFSKWGASGDCTDVFSNFYGCDIEFKGRKYSNAESALQAQKYTDRPDVMWRFEKVDVKLAIIMAKETPMASLRETEWNSEEKEVGRVDVAKNVLREKFNQNPDLKRLLMATGKADLIEQMPCLKPISTALQPEEIVEQEVLEGGVLHETGQENMLGILLMQLREEFGGAGIGEKPEGYLSIPQNQKQDGYESANPNPSSSSSSTVWHTSQSEEQ